MAQPDEAISQRFVTLLAERGAQMLGEEDFTAIAPELEVRKGISRLWKGSIKNKQVLSNEIDLTTKVGVLIQHLERNFGSHKVGTWLEDIYTKLERAYSPTLANEQLLPLVPERYLEKYRLRVLSQEELATMLEHERARDRELAKANAELREIDQRKSEFISVAAHQLRTPLTGIKWALDLLGQEQSGALTEEQKQVVAQMKEGNERVLAIVEEMLHADQIEAGRFTLSPKPCDLAALVDSAVAALAPSAKEHNVTIAVEPSPTPLPQLTLDGGKIRDAVQNLIDNAINYSKPGGVVRVALGQDQAHATIAISDQGIGIPASAQAQIFTRFFRAENARRAQPNGNGLGLYIAKNIVTLHGGTLSFQSQEGTGTTFSISLPLQSKA